MTAAVTAARMMEVILRKEGLHRESHSTSPEAKLQAGMALFVGEGEGDLPFVSEVHTNMKIPNFADE